jgi:glycosyltransferase involved in cell wall biosynthesis
MTDLANAATRPLLRFPWFPSGLLGLLRFLRKAAPFDLIVADNAYPLGAMVSLATRAFPTPFVATLSGGDFIANRAAGYGYGRYGAARLLMRDTFKRAAAVRALSPHAAAAGRALGCPEDKLAVLQRNVPCGAFPPDGMEHEAYRRTAREAAARRFGIQSRRVIAAVGRLVPIKGFDDLLRAVPAVAGSFDDVTVLHAGPNRRDEALGDYQAHLAALARRLGIGSRVVFAGPLPNADVRDLLGAADVVAVPSLEEGGNRIVMEAAAVGTPFVATRTSGNWDWSRDGRCGLSVEPAAPAQLAAALVQILGQPDMARAMGAAGRAAAAQFRSGPVAERFLMLCAAAMQGQPVGRFGVPGGGG